MRAIVRKIANALFACFVPRSYALNRAQNDIVALSEVAVHLTNARNTLERAARNAMQLGVPLILDTAEQHIRLSNGHLLNYSFRENRLYEINVSIGTNHSDHTFELAVWRMLESSAIFQGAGAQYVDRLGLNHCTIVGLDVGLHILFNQSAAANGAQALADS